MQNMGMLPKGPVVQDIVGSEADPEESFVVLEQLGEGNYGQVYKAYHKESGKIVAIKVVPISSDIDSLRKEI
jgi:serine/threonine protein kinase